jgi:hypothetical protein
MVLDILVSCGGCMQALLKCTDRVFDSHAAFLQLVTLALGLLTLIHLYLQTRCNELKILRLLFWRSDVLSDASQQTMKGDNVELLRLDLFDELFSLLFPSRRFFLVQLFYPPWAVRLLSVPLLSAQCFLRMASDAANF